MKRTHRIQHTRLVSRHSLAVRVCSQQLNGLTPYKPEAPTRVLNEGPADAEVGTSVLTLSRAHQKPEQSSQAQANLSFIMPDFLQAAREQQLDSASSQRGGTV